MLDPNEIQIIVALVFVVLLHRLYRTSTRLADERSLRQPHEDDAGVCHSKTCSSCSRSHPPSEKWGSRWITSATFWINTRYLPLPTGQWRVSPRQAEKRLAMYCVCVACGAFVRTDSVQRSFRQRTLRAMKARASRNDTLVEEGLIPSGADPIKTMDEVMADDA